MIRKAALASYLPLWCLPGILLSQTAPFASSAEQERHAVIQRSIQALETECQTFGDGNWNKWYERLAPFRADLAAKIKSCDARVPLVKGPWDTPTFLLEAVGDPPLFEDCNDAKYLAAKGDLDSWLKQRTVIDTVVRVKEWLKKQNIDLIFVPVPKMTEVYPDRVAGYVPAERMVSPQVRRLLLELLKADVEVVDLLPLFLAAREESAEPLYVPDDPHWSTRAQPIAARAIAERLRRYPFIKSSLAKPAMFREQKISKRVTGVWRQALKPYQLQRIQFFSLVTTSQVVTLLQKQPFQAVESSPVMLMGDSYCSAMNAMVAPGTAVDAYLSKEINLPISTLSVAGNTVQSIKEFVRDPVMLRDRKVIVWLVVDTSVCKTSGWTLPALPEPPPGQRKQSN